MLPVDHKPSDEVGRYPVHQEVHNQDPCGDEEDPAPEIHRLPHPDQAEEELHQLRALDVILTDFVCF